ncbi:pyruvate kinase [Miltoncostaea marina]|uniref:pyruvate kinase n=1 Tax=Miltoncostaea marina TaxID=2843215 RepID=UPI001C3DAB63|nr:pyruvate kinase [Miltoncostaea marina]
MPLSRRRTKILATVGPASDSDRTLRAMMEAGMDAVRLNLSHGTLEEALEIHRRVRRLAEDLGRPVGTLVDLPGPKIRAASFGRSAVELPDGHRLRLVPGRDRSTADVIQVDFEGLLEGIEPGDRISFGDGGIDIEVVGTPGDHVDAVVRHGGSLTGRPGVHIPSERLRVSTPTPEDLRILDAFVEAGVDMVALSFVRSAHDIRRLGTEPHPRGPLVVAKVETRSAVENLAGILDAAGAVMIARGDLGIECAIEDLPHLQKHIIRECIAHGRPAITATQMLESMANAPTPTRAEASDVANAVFDGSSAVMLSGETATGTDPVNVVATMARLCARADATFDVEGWTRLVTRLRVEDPEAGIGRDRRITDTMTDAAWRVAQEVGATAILCLTRTGFTVRAIARYRPRAPIIGFTTDERVRRQLSVSWGATPLLLSAFAPNDEMVDEAVRTAREEGHVRAGDIVVVLAGVDGRSSTTDVLRVVHVV